MKYIYVEDWYELGFFKSKVQWKSRMSEFELVCNYVPLAWQMKAGHEMNNEEFCIVWAVVKQDWKDNSFILENNVDAMSKKYCKWVEELVCDWCSEDWRPSPLFVGFKHCLPCFYFFTSSYNHFTFQYCIVQGLKCWYQCPVFVLDVITSMSAWMWQI